MRKLLFVISLIQTLTYADQFSQYKTQSDSLPADFPQIKIKVNTSPSPGEFFLSNFALSTGTENVPYLIIMDNEGGIVKYKQLKAPINTDFKMHSNGLLTYYDVGKASFYAMNNNLEVVDSFKAVEGWLTDEHEFRFLPDGGYVMLATQGKQVDMSSIVDGGKRNAIVTYCSIQEFDQNKNPVFIWKTEDHFPVTDAVGVDLTQLYVDYAHCNAIEYDTDGNIILSTRHLDEITKINRSTGEIIWRMGGKECKNNEFTFINDSHLGFFGFSHQHAIRRLDNGNFIMYDNGNLKTPQYSRAVEYSINQQTKIATKVWEYRNDPDYFGSAMGYAQRLENGNTVICWGACDSAVISEVTYNKEKVFEMSFGEGIFSYRGYKFNFIQTGIEDDPGIDADFSLEQNYPNPFNSCTNIEFTIIKPGKITIDIYNLLGEMVAKMVDGNFEKGSYNIAFAATGLSSGVYFYEVKTGSSRQIKKMIYLK